MSSNRKLLLTTFILFFIFVSILLLIISPSFKTIKKLSDEIYKERIDLEKLYLKGQNLKRSRQDFNKIKPEIPKLKGVFITPGEELSLITTLEEVATRFNLSQQINLGNITKKDSSLNILPLQLSLEGKFNEIVSYLISLEKLDYYINITHLSFRNEKALGTPFLVPGLPEGVPSGLSGQQTIKVEIEAEIYWL